MEMIDAAWIEARLTGKRGELAALARAIGVDATQISKIRSGERRVQPEEMAKIKAFFDGAQPAPDPRMQRIATLAQQLDDAEKDFLIVAAEGLISRHRGEGE